jgi:hypothetical protein
MALITCDTPREGAAASAVAPSVNSSRGTKLLPGVLSIVAGSVDVICFLGLGGLFAGSCRNALEPPVRDCPF